jgi:transposase
MEPIPVRMRERIIELYARGEPTAEIAAALGTSESGTRRVRQHLRERGTVEPRRPAVGRKPGLTGPAAAGLRAAVAADPGATRAELRARLGLAADVRTVGRWLRALGLTLKKSRSGPPSRTGRT